MDEHRAMPFGKYKGEFVAVLIAENPKYIDWMVKNTNFTLTKFERELLSRRLANLSNRRTSHYRFNSSQAALKAFGNTLDRNVIGANFAEDNYEDYSFNLEKQWYNSMKASHRRLQCDIERSAAYEREMKERFKSPSYDEMFEDMEYW